MATIPSKDLIVTASIFILNHANEPIQCRAILDTGSTSNFITEKLARQLNLPLKILKIPIMAVADPHLTTNHLMKGTIKSRINEYKRELNFLTVSSLGGLQPSEPIDRGVLKIPKHIDLADPRFDQPAPFEILLSSGTTLAMLCSG